MRINNKSRRGKKRPQRTDIVYNGVELGLVSSGEEDVESSSSKLDRKLASDAVRCARDDYSNDEEQSVTEDTPRHAKKSVQNRSGNDKSEEKRWSGMRVEKGVPAITHLPMRPSLLQTC